MGFRINTNISAMNAHKNSVVTNRNLDNSLEKLSSGLRINKAADDASGMAIADSLKSQANSLGQAIANANDAIGIIQTADKAMDEQIKILDTIKTKATQAAQDGQTTHTRKMIQSDITRLLEELDNIASTTSFNGRQLLSGTFTNREFQIGAYSNETVKVSVGATNSDRIGSVRAETGSMILNPMEVELKFLSSNGNGKDLKLERTVISTSAGTGIGVLAQNINKNSDQTGLRATFNVMSSSEKMIANGTVKDLKINGVVVGIINDIKNGDSDGRLINAINDLTSRTGVEAYTDIEGKMHLRSLDGRGIKITTRDEIRLDSEEEIKAGDIKNLVINDIKIGDIEGVLDGDADGRLVNTINSRSLETGVEARVEDNKLVLEALQAPKEVKVKSVGTILEGQVKGLSINGVNFPSIPTTEGDGSGNLVNMINSRSLETGVEARIEDDSLILEGLKDENGNYLNPDMEIRVDAQNMDFKGRGNSKYLNPDRNIYVTADSGPLRSNQTFNRISTSDENYGRLTLIKLSARDVIVSGIGGLAGFSGSVSQDTMNLKSIVGSYDANVASAIGANGNSVLAKDNIGGIGAGVTSLKGAMLVMDIADASIKELDRIRADLGSVQQQLVATINNISVTQVNVKAAESQIRDVDFAQESSNFTKNNILSQSGNFALSQANAVQQNVLNLLK